MTNFVALLRGLTAQSVEFIIVGGAAATAHRSARLTVDLFGEIAGSGTYES